MDNFDKKFFKYAASHPIWTYYEDRQEKWDYRFLKLAKEISSWSKDPSTKVGAIIARDINKFVSLGYNGFADKIQDTQERLNDRDIKYGKIIHGEINAILHAERKDLECATLYTWPFMPCNRCTPVIIQVGITRIVTPKNTDARWEESFKIARKDLREAGVQLKELPLEKINF